MKGRWSEWRGDPLTRRSRRSRSPLMADKRENKLQKRPYRSPDRRSVPREQQQGHLLRRPDHGKELVQEHELPPQHWSHLQSSRRSVSRERQQGHLLRRPDHGKELVQEHELLPLHRSHLQSSPRHRSLPTHDDGFRFQQHCLFPDHPSSNPSWRISESIRNDRAFYSRANEGLPSSSLDIEGKHMLPLKSSFIEEGPSRLLCSDQPVGSTILSSERLGTGGGSIGVRIKDNEMHSCKDRHRGPYDGSTGMRIEDDEMHSYNDLHRDQNSTMDGKQVYAKDSSLPKGLPSHLRAFTNGSSSSVLKEEFKGLHRDQIADGYDRSIGMRIEDNDVHSYNDCHKDQYGIMDRKQVYAKDPSFSKMPPSQLRAFTNGSSSSLLKEEFKGLHHDQISDGFATAIRRNPNDPLEHCYYRQVPQPDSLGHGLPDESLPQVYDYDKLHKRGLDDHQHMAQEEAYKMIAHPLRKNATSSTILDYNGDWMEKIDSPKRNLIKSTFLDHQDFLYQKISHDYHHVRAQQELLTNSDNYHDGLQIKSSRDYETRPFEDSITHEKKYFPMSYGAERRNRLSDYDLDEHRLVVRTCNRSHIDDLNDYDIERMQRRNHSIREDIDKTDFEVVFVNDRRSSEPCRSEEMWLTEEPVGHSHSKSMLSGHSFYKKISRTISMSDAFMPTCGASSMHAKNVHNINLKRRLKHAHSNFHSSSFSERRHDLSRPYKHRKREIHDRLGAQCRGALESGSHFKKNDPPEDSEEFKQKVHKAFLRYFKLLNESPHNRRMYQNQGNDYRVLCRVCGSSSKEFVDTNSLVIHTYHSLKVGLKTEHLGFHKALCILLGWNWHVPPENSRAYQSMPVAEIKSMQEDLILWPPLVIIHNSLIRGNITTKDAKAVTVKVLEKTLRDMGFAAGAPVCLEKPANQSIFTVKFMPTFSGLQEAQRLHNHFSDKKHGKREFQQAASSGKKNQTEEGSRSEEMDEILYGYMAVAKDLDKLGPENKKRSLVKSMKDIQDIANAPLNAD